MKPLFLPFLTILAACTECPRCPQLEPAPVAEVTLHPEPVIQSLRDAGDITDRPVEATWTRVDPMTLAGKWRSIDGRPLPTFELVIGEAGSKTPMNIDIRSVSPAHIGCGLYPSGAAYCKQATKVTDEPQAKAEELSASFLMNKDALLLNLGDADVARFTGQFVREASK